MTLEELNNKIQAFDIVAEIDKTIKDEQSVIVDTITQEQLYEKGIDGAGQSLGDYAPRTKVIKQAKGQKINNITLKDTGDFYAGFEVRGQNGAYEITSTDWKTPKLERMFGSKIFELTEQNKDEIIQKDIIPALTQKLQKAIS